MDDEGSGHSSAVQTGLVPLCTWSSIFLFEEEPETNHCMAAALQREARSVDKELQHHGEPVRNTAS